MILKTLPWNILLCLSTVEIHSLAVWPRPTFRPRLLSNASASRVLVLRAQATMPNVTEGVYRHTRVCQTHGLHLHIREKTHSVAWQQ